MINLKLVLFPIILIVLFGNSCGYFYSGTWEDEDKNWERAYNQELPERVKLIHSWYWRSPHWSLEQALYFEIEYNEEIKQNFLKSGNIEKVDSKDYHRISFFKDKPQWFVPKSFKFYDIWMGTKLYDNFILFIDKQDSLIFWTDYQL